MLQQSDFLKYKDNVLHCEDVSLAHLAFMYETPLYVYSRGCLINQFLRLKNAFMISGRAEARLSTGLGRCAEACPVDDIDLTSVEGRASARPRTCSSTSLHCPKITIYYAVKSNTNLAVINTFANQGAGADVVSAGEIYRSLLAGIKAENIVFAGVGKTVDEIEYALEMGVGLFTVESEPELVRISKIATKINKQANIAIRVNPAVDALTHDYISTGKRENKFGISIDNILNTYDQAARLSNIIIKGVHMHIGSQITSIAPYERALIAIIPICLELKKRYNTLQVLDIGGGFGIKYNNEQEELDLNDLARVLTNAYNITKLNIAIEPGRFLTGYAGVLLCKVEYIKRTDEKIFVIVNAAMNDLIRPALYNAKHEIVSVDGRAAVCLPDDPFSVEGRASARLPDPFPVEGRASARLPVDIVGPVCESADFFAMDYMMDINNINSGDILAIKDVGAYGFVMASNYNSRLRAAEVMVDSNRHYLIRGRDTYEDIINTEMMY